MAVSESVVSARSSSSLASANLKSPSPLAIDRFPDPPPSKQCQAVSCWGVSLGRVPGRIIRLFQVTGWVDCEKSTATTARKFEPWNGTTSLSLKHFASWNLPVLMTFFKRELVQQILYEFMLLYICNAAVIVAINWTRYVRRCGIPTFAWSCWGYPRNTKTTSRSSGSMICLIKPPFFQDHAKFRPLLENNNTIQHWQGVKAWSYEWIHISIQLITNPYHEPLPVGPLRSLHMENRQVCKDAEVSAPPPSIARQRPVP